MHLHFRAVVKFVICLSQSDCQFIQPRSSTRRLLVLSLFVRYLFVHTCRDHFIWAARININVTRCSSTRLVLLLLEKSPPGLRSARWSTNELCIFPFLLVWRHGIPRFVFSIASQQPTGSWTPILLYLLNPIYPGLYENLFTLREGGICPLPKIPGKCPLGLKLGGVPQGGLNITFKPKKVPTKYLWMS